MNCKIVHLTSVHSADDTRILHKECASLAKAGYEVVLIAPNASEGVYQGVRIRTVQAPASRISRFLNTTNNVVRVALQEDADVYHIHDPELLLWAQILRARGKTVIYDMHENVPAAILSKPWIPRYLRRPVSKLLRFLERALLYELPLIFAEESYVHFYPRIKKAVVVLNLPDSERLLTIEADKFEEHTVGYIGRVSANRGSLVTLEAMSLLQQQGLRAGLQCVGPMSLKHRQELNQKVSAYGLSDVTFHGRLALHASWRVMARCHVGLAILKPVPNYIESYPTKMFEYMALGLPIIVSDFPLYQEIISRYECGICVDPLNAREIADAILYLKHHPKTALRMGERGRQAVQDQFNWSSEAGKLLNFYRSLTEQ